MGCLIACISPNAPIVCSELFVTAFNSVQKALTSLAIVSITCTLQNDSSTDIDTSSSSENTPALSRRKKSPSDEVQRSGGQGGGTSVDAAQCGDGDGAVSDVPIAEEEEEEEDVCPICLLEMVDGESMVTCKEGCNNRLHLHCLKVCKYMLALASRLAIIISHCVYVFCGYSKF